MKFTLFLILGGVILLIVSSWNLVPGDHLDWWFPIQLLSLLMILVGIGRPFKLGRKIDP